MSKRNYSPARAERRTAGKKGQKVVSRKVKPKPTEKKKAKKGGKPPPPPPEDPEASLSLVDRFLSHFNKWKAPYMFFSGTILVPIMSGLVTFTLTQCTQAASPRARAQREPTSLPKNFRPHFPPRLKAE